LESKENRIFKFSILCFWFVLVLSSSKGEASSFSLSVNLPQHVILPQPTDFNSKKGLEREKIVADAMAQEQIERRKGQRVKLISITVK
jgi:hypothetical protein